MSLTPVIDSGLPVDALVTWVDGSDPAHKAKMEKHLSRQSSGRIPGASPTRFASVNEIRYCVLSILRFAPFIRNIFILTDGQGPGLRADIERWFPGRRDSVKIVDHREAFRGYEHYLPAFSSRSISSMAWRIEGLSDNFVYFNDDTFLIREVSRDDWFRAGRPVLRGTWATVPLFRILRDKVMSALIPLFRQGRDWEPRASYHMGQWGAALLAGFRWRYFYFGHAPFAIDRRVMERFFNGNQQLMEKNISYRFRNFRQYDFISLACHLELASGNMNITRNDFAYLQPYNRRRNYISGKIQICERNDRIRFLCVQSLEMCTPEEQKLVFNWLTYRLGMEEN
ncbi:MAG: capsular biosynthesis protein [Bacteroidetes bacterium]|nr:capsular biosynthesis protein [Bacteroidota bacterium]